MLRDLVQQARAGGTNPELEAVTAERDFFREKYIEQVDEMESLRAKLKESQRIIDRLRGDVLDLEMERSTPIKRSPARGRGAEGGVGGVVAAAITPKQIGGGSGGSTDTSVTCLTDNDDDLTTKSGVENSAEQASEAAEGPVAGDGEKSSGNDQDGEGEQGGSNDDEPEAAAAEKKQSTTPVEESGSEEDNGDEESDSEDDEAEKIRANAARMLLWANYQTSKRSTPNTSMIQDDEESKVETASSRHNTPSKINGPDAIVYSLPTSLDRRYGQLLDSDDDDDDSTLGSSSRHRPEPSVGSWRSGATTERASAGKVGRLFNNLRDMIDPPSEIDSKGGSDDESAHGDDLRLDC